MNRAIVCLFLLFTSSFAFALGEGKFIVDTHIAVLLKSLDETNRKITRLNTQLAGMTQTFFKDEGEKEDYERQKQTLRNEIVALQAKQKEIQNSLSFLGKKRALFSKSAYEQDHYDYYCATPIDPTKYHEALKELASIFEKLLPTVSLSFQTEPQIIIYPTKKDLEMYEQAPENLLENPLNPAWCQEGFLAHTFEGVKKHYFIVTFADENLAAFRHQATHLFTSRYLDPSNSPKPIPTSNFLMEGFAENLAVGTHEDLYEKDVQYVVEHPEGVKLMGVASLLPQKTAFNEKDPNKAYYYSEATMFVHWLSVLPDGFQLLKQLLSHSGVQYESLITTHQWQRNAPQNGYEEYYTWRKAEVERLRLKLQKSSAPGTASPVSPTQ